MNKDQKFFEYISQDVFGHITEISAKAMFGGWGFYKSGFIFAIIADGSLYFRTDETNQKDFENAGTKPFTYRMKNGKKTILRYWQLPENIMEDKKLLRTWIEKATRAAERGKMKKR